MEHTLTDLEKEQLQLIADALRRQASVEPDEALLGALIRKCMVRTTGKSFKLTEQGRRLLEN